VKSFLYRSAKSAVKFLHQ